MKKAIIFLLGATLVVFGACQFFGKRKVQTSYEEIPVTRGPLSMEFRQTGSVSPRNRLEIKSPVAGRIENVLVVEGQKVKKGQTIAWISSTERAALLDAARSKGEAELKKWEEIYKPTPIIAPLSGFIIARSKEPGQTLSTSDSILVMADDLIIEADVDETDLRYIRINQKVDFYLDAYPDQKFKGTVEHVAYESQVINNVTVYTVKIRPLQVPANFRAGMTATVDVKARQKDDALLLPYDAVTTAGSEKTVLMKTDTGQPELRKVETGSTNGKYIEIISGVNENDIVLTGGSGRRSGASSKKKRNMPRMMGIPGMGSGKK
jgi:macrolide-specific efflux system membrane fusion protein